MPRSPKKATQEESNLSLRDQLAIDRTKLANMRTLLAFFRTSLYLLVSALAVMKVDFLANLREYAWVFVGLAVLVLILGLIKFFQVKNRVKKLYKF